MYAWRIVQSNGKLASMNRNEDEDRPLQQPVYLRAPPDLVIPQRHAVVQHRFDFLWRGILLLPRLLVLFF